MMNLCLKRLYGGQQKNYQKQMLTSIILGKFFETTDNFFEAYNIVSR